MANATFDAAVDYFGLVAASSPKLKVTSSNENRSKQTASGANSYGDIAVVDAYGETAAPSAEYDIIAACTESGLTALGTCATPTGCSKPIVLGSLTITTSSGALPAVSASGQEVQSGAATLRTYALPPINLTTRHRAQEFLCTKTGTTYTSIMEIKKGSASASDVADYGLESVSATFPCEISLGQPKGELVNYDIHGGTITGQFTMNWYASTAPTIALTTAASTAGWTMTSPLSKSDPKNGYTQYTWTVSKAFTGTEYTAS